MSELNMPEDLRATFSNEMPGNWPEVLESRAAARYIDDTKGTVDLLRATAIYIRQSLSQSHSTGAAGRWFELSGDTRLGRCATEGCGGQPAFRLEAYGIGSEYCSGCAAKIRALSPVHKDGEAVYPRCANVRAHKHTCANVQPGSTLADKCDCGALDTAGNAIPLHSKEAEVTVTEEMVEQRAGIYVASKVAHAKMWRDLRDFKQEPIISTWIDEAGVGESASLEDLWRRCVHEASNAGALIIYRRPEEVLKGAWVELGAALSCGVPVFAVGIEEFTVANHKGITHCGSMDEARRLARAALVAALSRKG